MTTNEKNCLLAHICRYAGQEQHCSARCPYFVNLHGITGDGSIAGRANIPRDYRMITLNNSPAKNAKVHLKQNGEIKTVPIAGILENYVATFTRQFEDGAETIKSLYLYSPTPGTGKTTTAAALANEYLIRHYLGSRSRGLQPLDRPVFFLSVNRWHSKFMEFNRKNVPESIGGPAAEEYYTMHDIAKRAQFLVIDDIGVRMASEAFNMDVLDLVDTRVSNRLPTVYTSNVPVEHLSELYDARVFDRVRDLCLILEFAGSSHRGMTR